MANNNLIDLLIELNSGLKQDYGSKIREKKNSDTKDHSFDVPSALPLIAILSYLGFCILPNRLAVPSCRIIFQNGRAIVIKDRCLK